MSLMLLMSKGMSNLSDIQITLTSRERQRPEGNHRRSRFRLVTAPDESLGLRRSYASIAQGSRIWRGPMAFASN